MAVIINNPITSPGFGDLYGTIINNPLQTDPAGGGGDPLSQASLWVASAVNQPYEFYEVQTFRTRDLGVRKMCVAGSAGTKAEVIQVCAPYGMKVVAYAAGRKLIKPQLPVVEPNSANQILRNEWHRERALTLAADGETFRWWFWGMYVYDYLVPLSPSTGDQLSFGQPPTFDGSSADPGGHVVTPSDFITGITTGD